VTECLKTHVYPMCGAVFGTTFVLLKYSQELYIANVGYAFGHARVGQLPAQVLGGQSKVAIIQAAHACDLCCRSYHICQWCAESL